MTFNIMDAEAESGDFSLIPKGRYPAVVEDAEFRNFSDNTKVGWNIEFVLNKGEYENRHLWTNIVFPNDETPEEKAAKILGYIKGNLIGLGFAESELVAAGDPENFDVNEFIGRECVLAVRIRKYKDAQGNDELVNDVRLILPTDTDTGDSSVLP